MSLDMNALVERYVQIRDKRAELDRAHKDRLKQIDDALSMIESAMMQHLQATGTESVGTASGTAYIKKNTSATVADFDALLSWIREREAWQFLDRRVNKTAVQEFREAEGDIPPGINWREENVVQVRRS